MGESDRPNLAARLRPGLGPARGVFFALTFGTGAWLVILSLIALVRRLL